MTPGREASVPRGSRSLSAPNAQSIMCLSMTHLYATRVRPATAVVVYLFVRLLLGWMIWPLAYPHPHPPTTTRSSYTLVLVRAGSQYRIYPCVDDVVVGVVVVSMRGEPKSIYTEKVISPGCSARMRACVWASSNPGLTNKYRWGLPGVVCVCVCGTFGAPTRQRQNRLWVANTRTHTHTHTSTHSSSSRRRCFEIGSLNYCTGRRRRRLDSIGGHRSNW